MNESETMAVIGDLYLQGQLDPEKLYQYISALRIYENPIRLMNTTVNGRSRHTQGKAFPSDVFDERDLIRLSFLWSPTFDSKGNPITDNEALEENQLSLIHRIAREGNIVLLHHRDKPSTRVTHAQSLLCRWKNTGSLMSYSVCTTGLAGYINLLALARRCSILTSDPIPSNPDFTLTDLRTLIINRAREIQPLQLLHFAQTDTEKHEFVGAVEILLRHNIYSNKR